MHGAIGDDAYPENGHIIDVGSETLDCQATILVPIAQAHTGPFDQCWVLARTVSVDW